MIDKKKELRRIVFNLSQRKEFQIKYLDKLFKGMSYNLDELLLEFEDSRCIWGIYGEYIYGLLTYDLSILLEKIDDLGLHELDDLSHVVWDEVREVSSSILSEIRLLDEKGLGKPQQDASCC